MPIRNGDYERRDEEGVFESLVTELLDEEPDANPRADATYTNALLRAIAATIAQNQEQSLQHIYRAAYVQDAEGTELTKKARNLGVIRRPARTATGVVTFSRDENASSDITIPAGTVVETLSNNPVQFETTTTATIESGTQTASATVEAQAGGSQGNVGANAIQSLPSPPVELEVTNNEPTGDPSLTDTTGDPLQAGRDEEDDETLRQRVLNTDASDEGPSASGIELALANVPDVISAHINTNQDTTATNGLDAYHSEAVVYGGDVYDIAYTLYETMSATAVLRLQGGVNGTKETTTVYSDLLDQDITIPITRPTTVTFDMDIDVVHTNTYAGDVAVKDTIVEYTGGIRADDSSVIGQGIGENVLINEVENRVEDVQGVDYAAVTLVDTNSDGTDDTTTDSDGVPILEISNSEVARPDADNITVNTTAR